MASAAAKDTVTAEGDQAEKVSSPRNKNIRGYGDGPKPLPQELQQQQQDTDPASMPKRVVALHIGYVGTNYRGVYALHILRLLLCHTRPLLTMLVTTSPPYATDVLSQVCK